ncbi:MAG TPA: MFS transporter [Nevskiaceae bacterium]|nr:MFS transporter [Nevskiaceae bacterium]
MHGVAPLAASVRRGPVFTIIALALMMMSIDATIVATALHAIQQGLGTTINWAGWTITAYGFGFLLIVPVSGVLCERYGQRRVFLVSVMAFTLASLCCALAHSIGVLIALRVVQAAGGAGFTPSATGIVVDHFGVERDRYVALFGSIFPIGVVLGPVFGALFVSYLDWRWVFIINVPIGLTVLAFAWRLIPRDVVRHRRHEPLDGLGMALLGVGLTAGMFAISDLGERSVGWASPLVWIAAAVAALALWAFFRRLSHTACPFIAPQLIYGRGFLAVNLLNVIYGGAIACVGTLVPLYAINRYRMDTLDSGTLLVAQGVAAVVASFAAAMTIRRTGYRWPIYAGGAVVVVGTALLALAPPFGLSPYLWLAVVCFLLGLGGGTLNPASRNAGLQLAPEHSATLTALRSMSQSLGSIAMISIVTAALASSPQPGATQGWVYVGGACALLLLLPLTHRIPEHRGAW